MINNDKTEVYIITHKPYNDDVTLDIIGYTDNIKKAQEFCDNKELITGETFNYKQYPNISRMVNRKPKVVNFKAYYNYSKENICISRVEVLGENKDFLKYENEWPVIDDDAINRDYFYFSVDFEEMNVNKKQAIIMAKNKAADLLDDKYKTDNKFMHFVNKQILKKEGIIDTV